MKEQAKDLLRGYVRHMAAGFLLAVPRSGVVLKKDFVSPAELHVLNAARFGLSLDPPFTLPTSGDGPNTIFHPQIPHPGSWWKIRAAY